MACQTFFFSPGETRPQKNGILQIYRCGENLLNWTVENVALWRNFTMRYYSEFSWFSFYLPQPFGLVVFNVFVLLDIAH